MGAGAGSEPAHAVAHVGATGVGREQKSRSDLFTGQALDEECEDLELPGGENGAPSDDR